MVLICCISSAVIGHLTLVDLVIVCFLLMSIEIDLEVKSHLCGEVSTGNM